MEEIKVGEYVRTRKGIAKIKEKIGEVWDKGIAYEVDKNGTVITDYSFSEFIYETDIIKHSKNIIDLIEVGDYINGWKVLSIVTTYDKPNEIGIKLLGFDNLLYDVKIQSIVTKEQMEAIQYVIK